MPTPQYPSSGDSDRILQEKITNNTGILSDKAVIRGPGSGDISFVITSPQSDDLLQYNSTLESFTNRSVSSVLGSFVTLTTSQSISGNKTFSGTQDFTGATVRVPTLGTSENSTKAASTAWVRTLTVNDISLPLTAVSFNSQRISNVSNPSYNQDAATKIYVDTAVAAAGNVHISGTPSNGQFAQWVSGTAIQGVGSTGTGNVVRDTSPTITTPTISTITAASSTDLVLNGGSSGGTIVVSQGSKVVSIDPRTGTNSSTFNITARVGDVARTFSMAAATNGDFAITSHFGRTITIGYNNLVSFGGNTTFTGSTGVDMLGLGLRIPAFTATGDSVSDSALYAYEFGAPTIAHTSGAASQPLEVASVHIAAPVAGANTTFTFEAPNGANIPVVNVYGVLTNGSILAQLGDSSAGVDVVSKRYAVGGANSVTATNVVMGRIGVYGTAEHRVTSGTIKSQAVGVSGYANDLHDGTGTFTSNTEGNLIGVRGKVERFGNTGTMAEMTAMSAHTFGEQYLLDVNHPVTDVTAYLANGPSQPCTFDTWTNYYGFRLRVNGSSSLKGAITNFYGLKIDPIVTDGTITSKWAIYADSDPSYFGGALTLGSSINKVTITAPASGATLTIADGKTFTASNTLTLSGTDGSSLNIGSGGTLGSAAFTSSGAYEVPITFSTGLTRSTNVVTVNTTQNIAKLSNLTSNGFVKTSGGDGTLSVSTITTSDVSGLGTIATQSASSVTITGGSINGTSVGVTSQAQVVGTTVSATTYASTPPAQAALFGAAGPTEILQGAKLWLSNMANSANARRYALSLQGGGTTTTKIGIYRITDDLESGGEGFYVIEHDSSGHATEHDWYINGTLSGKVTSTGFQGAIGATTPSSGVFTTAKITTLTSNGFVKTTGGDGTFTVDTNSYAASVDIQNFTSNGTWTKPSGAKFVRIIGIGNGGGGGSGRRGAAGTNRFGGAGGGGGGYNDLTFPASVLGSTETVTIGSVGTGGASQTSDNTNGNAGTAGSDVTFGSWFRAGGGSGGPGGSTATAVGAAGGTGLYSGTNGGNGRDDGGNGVAGTGLGGTGGGGGLGTDSTEYTGSSGSGGHISGTLRTAVNTDGTTVASGYVFGGTGGTGGSVGGSYGGGGGGGFGNTNGANSGAGGNGGPGIIQVITYF